MYLEVKSDKQEVILEAISRFMNSEPGGIHGKGPPSVAGAAP
jgi:hypothetical protein